MQARQKWTNVSIVTADGVEELDLLIEGGRFSGLIARDAPIGEDWRVVDGQEKILFPGVIDLLQHGFKTYLYNDVEPGCVADNSQLLAQYGVTGFLPSISSLPPDTTVGVLAGLADQCGLATGARALGVHSEGPCFGSPGAHNPENLLLPSAALAEEMLQATGGKLAAVTIAPELPGAKGFIRAMKQAGVSVHLGHSQAKPEDIPEYVSWGIDAVTHMYNVMPNTALDRDGVHTVTLCDALLGEPDLALGLICDGIHVHPQLVRLLSNLSPDRVFLETDAIKYAGGEETEFEFYPGYWVRSAKGKAVRDRDGGLCGSSLTPHEALLNYLKFSGKDLSQAAMASSLVPARVLGLDREMGSIEAGKLADFVALDRQTLQVEQTFVSGRNVYRRAP